MPAGTWVLLVFVGLAAWAFVVDGQQQAEQEAEREADRVARQAEEAALDEELRERVVALCDEFAGARTIHQYDDVVDEVLIPEGRNSWDVDDVVWDDCGVEVPEPAPPAGQPAADDDEYTIAELEDDAALCAMLPIAIAAGNTPADRAAVVREAARMAHLPALSGALSAYADAYADGSSYDLIGLPSICE